MTHAAALFLDTHPSSRKPAAHSGVRRRWTRSGKEAALTTAAVAVGLAIVTTALPPPKTPGNVASAFLEAWFRTEGSPARILLCESNRAVTDSTFISTHLVDPNQHYVFPHLVEVHVDEVRAARGSEGPFLTVTVTATSRGRSWEGWTFPAEVPLVREDGELRVCFAQDTAPV
jgi:hypothetical protein